MSLPANYKQKARYRRISVRMWGDDKFEELSKPQPNAQTLWIYLLTGPHTGPLPGAFVSGEAGLAEALDWPLEDLRRCFKELMDRRMICVDWKKRLIFVPNAVVHNAPESPNVATGWRSAFDELPDCELKTLIFNHVEVFLKGLSKAFAEAFAKSSRKVDKNYQGTLSLIVLVEGEGEGEGEGTNTGSPLDNFSLTENLQTLETSVPDSAISIPEISGAKSRPRDLAMDFFSDKCLEFTGVPYLISKGDATELTKLRKAFKIANLEMPPGWTEAVDHYFASPRGKISLAQLATPANYAIYKNSPVDRYSVPINHSNGGSNGKRSTESPADARARRSKESTERLAADLLDKTRSSLPR